MNWNPHARGCTIVEIPRTKACAKGFNVRVMDAPSFTYRLIPTRTLFTLLILGLLSDRFSLDFFGLCWVCDVKRAHRRSLRAFISKANDESRGILASEKVRVELASYTTSVSTGPLVLREYDKRRKRDRDALESYQKRKRNPPTHDLGVLSYDRLAKISKDYRELVVGRSTLRDGYRFAPDKIAPVIAVLIPLVRQLPKVDVDWAKPEVANIFSKLQSLLEMYKFETYLQLLNVVKTRAENDQEGATLFTSLASFGILDAKFALPGSLTHDIKLTYESKETGIKAAL